MPKRRQSASAQDDRPRGAVADRYPGKFPGAPCGEAVLAAGLGTLLNVHVDGWAEVNLPGFAKVIGTTGGGDVTVRNAL